NTTSNDVIGAGNALSVIRTAPLNPPLHTFVVTTSTVTPPPDTATSAWSAAVSTPAHAATPTTMAAYHDERRAHVIARIMKISFRGRVRSSVGNLLPGA